MKIEMPTILETDINLKTTISLLVDSIEFSKDIQEARSHLGITEFLESASPNTIENFAYSLGYKDHTTYLSMVNKTIKGIRQKYSRTANHDVVIRWVLFTNTVPKGVFKHACYQKVRIDADDEYQYIIVLDPRSTEKDIKTAFLEFRNELFGIPTRQITKIANQGFPGEYLPPSHDTKYDFEAGRVFQEDAEMMGEEMSKGPLYAAANKELVTFQKNIDFNRSMFWLRYELQINDPTKKPRTNEEVLDEWHKLCPYKEQPENHDDKSCKYCSVTDTGTIQDAIDQHTAIIQMDF